MISASQKKLVKSLVQKKFRKQHNCFLVEGVKMVEEAIASDYEVLEIYANTNWIESHPDANAALVSNKELTQLSAFKTPNEVIAVVSQKNQLENDYNDQLTLALDFVQDPGNLGTIIRTADWFGIKEIVCSSDSVDCFNPKVVQASMGSIFRVKVSYLDLPSFFKEYKSLEVYGAQLDGKSIQDTPLNKSKAVILLGNESKGISSKLSPYITQPIRIDRMGSAESLNVASAAAILCYAFNA